MHKEDEEDDEEDEEDDWWRNASDSTLYGPMRKLSTLMEAIARHCILDIDDDRIMPSRRRSIEDRRAAAAENERLLQKFDKEALNLRAFLERRNRELLRTLQNDDKRNRDTLWDGSADSSFSHMDVPREKHMCICLLPKVKTCHVDDSDALLDKLTQQFVIAIDNMNNSNIISTHCCQVLQEIRVHYIKKGKRMVTLRGDNELTVGHEFTSSFPCVRVSLSLVFSVQEKDNSKESENVVGDFFLFLQSQCECLMSCEQLTSSPVVLPLLSHGIHDITVKHTIKTEELLQMYRTTGLLLVSRALREEECSDLYTFVRRRIQHCEHQIASRGIHVGRDTFAFKEVASRGNHRFDLLLDIDHNDAQIEPVLDMLTNISHKAPWMYIVKSLLSNRQKDEDILYNVEVSVVYSRPGAPHQDWHADGPHIRMAQESRESITYGVCVFVPIVDLNDKTGCTQFWMGSHNDKGLIGFGAAAEIIGESPDKNFNLIFRNYYTL